ncbi:MAG: WD40 repeat domain-containing protein [Spirochaetia bacterium]|nr:WD40 repeat domain-containing protein [Spirochaetia bacterium]
MKRVFILSLVIMLISISAAWTDSRVLISTGHTERINELAFQKSKDTLFSAGNDGTLRVWDINSKKLLYKLQISHLPIEKIAVHPSKPEVALVRTDRINTFHLSVWNYKTGKELYSHKIEEIPLFLKYSPKGTYLIYSRTDWKSLVFLRADTGQFTPVIDEGFGIVSDVFLSQSENTLVTYNSSGTIRYWNTETGEQKTTPISTIADMNEIHFSGNGVYMLGRKENTLYLVNLINGQIETRKNFERLYGYSYNPSTSLVTTYITENSRPRFLSFRVEQNSSLRPVQSSLMAPDDIRPPLQLIGSTLYFCKQDGSILTQSAYSTQPETFSRSVLLKISDLGFSEDSIYLLTEKNILSLSSKAFTSKGQQNVENSNFSFLTEKYQNPLNTAAGITVLSDKQFLLYPVEGPSNDLYLFNENRFRKLNTQLNGTVQAAERYNEDVLLLEEGGILRIVDPRADEELFNYSSFGLQGATKAGDENIVVARNKNALINTTLLSINPQTSETVPIPDRNLLTFVLEYDSTTRSLYSLGFEERRNSIRTVLKEHQGRNYGRVATLLSYPGEDNEATLAIDPSTSRVFTSLGYGDVHMFTWDGFTTMEQIEHIPRKLFTNDSLLYSLNGDSSVSVWDINRGNLLMTLYLFESLDWAIAFADGSFYGTDGAEQWIHQAD